MQLIYRGHTYEYTPSVNKNIYRKPRALNWRYQVPGEHYGINNDDTIDDYSEMAYRKPRALNWRYQMAAF